MSMRLHHLHLLLLAAGTHGAFDLTLRITREVRGAALPVDPLNAPCADVSSCDCFGGAHRRRAYMGPLPAGTVALDTGSYFSGGGRFYAAYDGLTLGDFFADCRYTGFGLTYRDFNVGSGSADLANYLNHVSGADPRTTVPTATVTNLMDATGTELDGLVSDYTLVTLGADDADGGVTHKMAVLSLTDPTHLVATQPATAARLLPFERALSVTVHKLKSLADVPTVIAVMVTDIPISAEELTAAGSMRAAKTAALVTLVRGAIGVDLFILGAFDVDPADAPQGVLNRISSGSSSSPVATMQNWAVKLLSLPPHHPSRLTSSSHLASSPPLTSSTPLASSPPLASSGRGRADRTGVVGGGGHVLVVGRLRDGHSADQAAGRHGGTAGHHRRLDHQHAHRAQLLEQLAQRHCDRPPR